MKKLKLRNPNFCDGCEDLEILPVLSQMHRCKIYKINMLAQHDAFIANKGIGYYPRPEKCKEEDVCPDKKGEGHIKDNA